MTNTFAYGFLATIQFLGLIMGGASAVALCAAGIGFAVFLLAAAFDWVTSRIARRWKRKGKKPKGRIAAVIFRSVQDDGKV